MLAFRLLLIALFLSTPCYAGTIALAPVSADATAAGIDSNFDTIVDVINGNIAGASASGATVNILANSVAEIDMADDANPRLRDSELLNITVDTISGGAIATQGTVVESGCVQATGTTASNPTVSACVAYVNGYRVSKNTESPGTYSNNSTSYLWISQTGSYIISTNGNENQANSALLAEVITNGTDITTVTNLFTTRVPSLVIPADYRNGMLVSRDSATTMVVTPGSVEVNNTMLTKTSNTTLTLGTDNDWADGTAAGDRATNTYGYVGIDASGNIRMDDVAPTNSDYALSKTDGVKRYATWSSTIYRILGYFYMNGATSGQLDAGEVSNIPDGNARNVVYIISNDDVTTTDTAFPNSSTLSGTNLAAELHFFGSGGKVSIKHGANYNNSAAGRRMAMTVSPDNVDTQAPLLNMRNTAATADGEDAFHASSKEVIIDVGEGTTTFTQKIRTSGDTMHVKDRYLIVEEVAL